MMGEGTSRWDGCAGVEPSPRPRHQTPAVMLVVVMVVGLAAGTVLFSS